MIKIKSLESVNEIHNRNWETTRILKYSLQMLDL